MKIVASYGILNECTLGCPHSDSKPKFSRSWGEMAVSNFAKGDYSTAMQLFINKYPDSANSTNASILHNHMILKFHNDTTLTPVQLINKLNSTANNQSASTNLSLIASYNICVLLFKSKQYRSCFERIEKEMARRQQMSEQMVYRFIFLLLEVYFVLMRCKEEGVRERSSAYLSLLDSISSGLTAANTKAPKKNEATSDSESEVQDQPISTLKFNYHMFRTRFLIASQSFKMAIREIKSAIMVCQSGPPSILLKSLLEYQEGNYSKSMKLLQAFQKGNEDADGPLPLMFFNNMGCLSYHEKKHRIAAYYVSRALNHSISMMSSGNSLSNPNESKSIPMTPSSSFALLKKFGDDRNEQILYNSGLIHLLNGHPETAFTFFQGASALYYNDPYIWLRLGECVSQIHANSINANSKRRGLGVDSVTNDGASIPNGPFILLPTGHTQGLVPDELSGKSRFKDVEYGACSLEYGKKCLLNCITLAKKDGNTSLLQAALINLSYISLAGGDMATSISVLREFNAIPGDLIPSYRILSHIFAAEAYCNLGQPQEALRHLSPSLLEDIVLEGCKKTHIPQCANSNTTFRAISRFSLLHNLVIAHALKDDLVTAQDVLSKAVQACPPSHKRSLLLLCIYIELRGGNTTTATELFKRGRSVEITH